VSSLPCYLLACLGTVAYGLALSANEAALGGLRAQSAERERSQHATKAGGTKREGILKKIISKKLYQKII
jgi:hypothetical protein